VCSFPGREKLNWSSLPGIDLSSRAVRLSNHGKFVIFACILFCHFCRLGRINSWIDPCSFS
jgi:hypothetical protein